MHSITARRHATVQFLAGLDGAVHRPPIRDTKSFRVQLNGPVSTRPAWTGRTNGGSRWFTVAKRKPATLGLWSREGCMGATAIRVLSNEFVSCRTTAFGLWRICFPPVLVRTGRRLPVQALGERGVLVSVTGYPRGGAPGPG